MSAPATALAEEVADLAVSRGREDLATRLRERARELSELERQVVVVGAYKSGKSAVVNGLLGASLCFEGVVRDAELPSLVRFGPHRSAALAVSGGVGGGPSGPELRPVELGRAIATQLDPPRDATGMSFTVPRRLLRSGLVVVDTPGFGGLESPAAVGALAVASEAAVVMFVTEATRELTLTEIDSLRRFRSANRRMILVETKADLTRHADAIAARDHRHLARAGLGDVQVVVVSCALRATALTRDLPLLNDRSGFPELTKALARLVRSAPVVTGLPAEIADVIAQLQNEVQATRAALGGAQEAQSVAESHRVARAQADALRKGAARWQAVLAEGVAALNSEAEFDLRGRIRAIQAAVESEIDSSDPARRWDPLCREIETRVAEELMAHMRFMEGGVAELAVRISEHFRVAGVELTIDLEDEWRPMPAEGVSGFELGRVEVARSGVLNGALVALRGSYGGMMVFGFLGSMIGFAVLNPLTLVAGVGLGGKAIRDERHRQLALRRTQARNAARRALDELTFMEVKRTRDAVRRVQGALRAGFLARIDELQHSLDAAAAAAKTAAGTHHGDRSELRDQLDASWKALERLSTRVRELENGSEPPGRNGARS